MGKTLDPTETPIAWFPDEGAFMIVKTKTETVEVGGVSVAVEINEPGAKVTWVDDAPGDREDGSGHFEQWSGSDENYEAQKVAEEEAE